MNDDLFASATIQLRKMSAPLSDRMRPVVLDEFVGQEHILGPGKLLHRLLQSAAQENSSSSERPLPSLILWGPPGTGKTTLAFLIAKALGAYFERFSAVAGGIKEARACIEKAAQRLKFERQRTILFVDEIHRFNKAQQDAFLPSVENGTIALFGATTENPSFEVNSALLSRSRVFVLKALEPADISKLLQRALVDSSRGLPLYLKEPVALDAEAEEALGVLCGGDARMALNGLELSAMVAPLDDRGVRQISKEIVLEALQRNTILYDRSGEEHYNLISALHKAIRNSDPDASLYYLARMIEGGEDPLFIARRLLRIASEDIGLADPQAVVQAMAAREAAHFIGYPECDSGLAQATVYLACAPKSNAIYMAINQAREEVKKSGALPVPLHFRNAPTPLAKQLGYKQGYQYDHDWPEKVAPQQAMPDALQGRNFYHPGALGFEKEIQKRIEYFARVRARLRGEIKDPAQE